MEALFFSLFQAPQRRILRLVLIHNCLRALDKRSHCIAHKFIFVIHKAEGPVPLSHIIFNGKQYAVLYLLLHKAYGSNPHAVFLQNHTQRCVKAGYFPFDIYFRMVFPDKIFKKLPRTASLLTHHKFRFLQILKPDFFFCANLWSFLQNNTK